MVPKGLSKALMRKRGLREPSKQTERELADETDALGRRGQHPCASRWAQCIASAARHCKHDRQPHYIPDTDSHFWLLIGLILSAIWVGLRAWFVTLFASIDPAKYRIHNIISVRAHTQLYILQVLYLIVKVSVRVLLFRQLLLLRLYNPVQRVIARNTMPARKARQ